MQGVFGPFVRLATDKYEQIALGDAGDIADGRLEVVQIDAIVLQLNQFHVFELISKYLACPVI